MCSNISINKLCYLFYWITFTFLLRSSLDTWFWNINIYKGINLNKFKFYHNFEFLCKGISEAKLVKAFIIKIQIDDWNLMFTSPVDAGIFRKDYCLVFWHRKLMMWTYFYVRVVFHRFNLDKIDMNAWREDSPCQRINCLLESIFHFCAFKICRFFTYSQKSMIASGRKENWHWIEFNFSCLSLHPSL